MGKAKYRKAKEAEKKKRTAEAKRKQLIRRSMPPPPKESLSPPPAVSRDDRRFSRRSDAPRHPRRVASMASWYVASAAAVTRYGLRTLRLASSPTACVHSAEPS